MEVTMIGFVRSNLHIVGRQIADTVRDIREVNALVREVGRYALSMSLLGAVFSGLSGLGVFAVAGYAIHYLSGGKFEAYTAPGGISWHMLAWGIALIAICYLITAVVQEAIEWRSQVFGDRLNRNLEVRGVQQLKQLDPGRLSDPDFIRLKDRALEWRGISSIEKLFKGQQSLVAGVAGVAASVTVMLALDPFFLALAIIPVVFEVLKAAKYDRRQRAQWESTYLARRRMRAYQYSLTEVETLLQAKLVRADSFWFVRYCTLSQNVQESEEAVFAWEFRWRVLIAVARALIIMLVIVYLGRELVAGNLAVSSVALFLGGMHTLGNSLGNLSRMFVQIQAHRKDYAYWREFLSTQPLTHKTTAFSVSLSRAPEIAFDRVTFWYPQTTKPALSEVSLTIKGGEKIALVGENGSGKTTLLRLLANIYEVGDGVITVDSMRLDSVTQESWYGHLLYVTQDYRIPEFTVQEALTGCEPAQLDHRRFAESLRRVRMENAIMALPDKAATQIGHNWPGGWEPSAGQYQRLKIAGALYRLGEPRMHIALFDEPMSNCDVETRDDFYGQLKQTAGKTIVVVAHDPWYLHYFDRIIVMHDGKVAEDHTTPEAVQAYRNRVLAQTEGSRLRVVN